MRADFLPQLPDHVNAYIFQLYSEPINKPSLNHTHYLIYVRYVTWVELG
jgi:hypothetical protein